MWKMETKVRLGILGSGKGSNMVALAEACRKGELEAEIAQVVSDIDGAGIVVLQLLFWHRGRFGPNWMRNRSKITSGFLKRPMWI